MRIAVGGNSIEKASGPTLTSMSLFARFVLDFGHFPAFSKLLTREKTTVGKK